MSKLRKVLATVADVVTIASFILMVILLFV